MRGWGGAGSSRDSLILARETWVGLSTVLILMVLGISFRGLSLGSGGGGGSLIFGSGQVVRGIMILSISGWISSTSYVLLIVVCQLIKTIVLSKEVMIPR